MSKKTLIATAVGSALVAGMAAAPIVSAAENPFAMQSLDKGYMLSQAEKMGDGKCGQGKCGGMKTSAAKASAADSSSAGMPDTGMPGPAMLDTNKDGKVSRKEFMNGHAAMFKTMDTNKDGYLDQAEMNKMMEGKCGGMK
ncbi:MAG: EF-hand domain-containing protein [Thiobacillus sp.]|nr:EF-hand domain-containing protein [Thiobacillus sp.]